MCPHELHKRCRKSGRHREAVQVGCKVSVNRGVETERFECVNPANSPLTRTKQSGEDVINRQNSPKHVNGKNIKDGAYNEVVVCGEYDVVCTGNMDREGCVDGGENANCTQDTKMEGNADCLDGVNARTARTERTESGG